MDRPQRGFEPIGIATSVKPGRETQVPQVPGPQKGFEKVASAVPAKPTEKQQIAPQIRSPQVGFESIGSVAGNAGRYDPANRQK